MIKSKPKNHAQFFVDSLQIRIEELKKGKIIPTSCDPRDTPTPPAWPPLLPRTMM